MLSIHKLPRGRQQPREIILLFTWSELNTSLYLHLKQKVNVCSFSVLGLYWSTCRLLSELYDISGGLKPQLLCLYKSTVCLCPLSKRVHCSKENRNTWFGTGQRRRAQGRAHAPYYSCLSLQAAEGLLNKKEKCGVSYHSPKDLECFRALNNEKTFGKLFIWQTEW